MPCGACSFARAGVAWGNATARYNTPTGQGAKITFTDGVETTFTRLERPHLAFKGNAMVGDPIYLINSAQYVLRAHMLPCHHRHSI